MTGRAGPAAPVAARQVPGAGAVILDHVAFFAPGLGAAEVALARLGFALTPFTAQRNRVEGRLVPAGTGNRLALLEAGYLEVLTPTGEDTPIARQFQAAIARYPGLHAIAFGEADAEAAHRRLAAAGFDPLPLVALERKVPTEAGEAPARFAVVRIAPGLMPEGRIQVCRHLTPEVVWQERWLGQPNGARALCEVLIAVADAGEAAARFARFTGIAPRAHANRTIRIETARGALAFAEPAVLAALPAGLRPPALPWIGAIALEVAEPQATAAILTRGGVPFARAAAGALVVPPEHGLGAAIAFTAAGAPAPWAA